MNSALEVLFLRRPVIEYVSPSICEVDFSSSGVPVIILDPLSRLGAPSGLVIGGGGNSHRFSWSNYPGVLCYSVYKLVDELDPFGPYMLIAECISDNFIDLDEEGTYRITAITPDGETPFSDPFHVTFPVPPPSIITLDFVDMDFPSDFSEDATIITGSSGTSAAVYKDGAVTTHGTLATFSAVSPDGKWVVGYDYIAGMDNMVSYDFATYRNLGNHGGPFGTILLDVNNSGHGVSGDKMLVNVATGGTIVDIAGLMGGHGVFIDFGHPHVISAADQVPLDDTTLNRPVRYSAGVVPTITPPDWLIGQVNPTIIINGPGHVVETYIDTGSQNRTFFFNGAASASIGDFGGFVTASAISNTDWVVGQADNGSSFYGAFRWSPTTPLEMLPLIDSMTPGSQGSALSVNDAGWIVGVMDNKAFVYHDGVSIELTTLIPAGSGWTSLDLALFINNLKQVVGLGTYLGNPNRVFLMQLV